VWFAKQAARRRWDGAPVARAVPCPASPGGGTTSLLPVDDRHARHRRADADPRRRPSDGFRAGTAARFERLVGDALALAPPGLLRYLDDLQIVIDLVPPVSDAAHRPGDDPTPLLAHYETGAPADRVRLYRRPLEARARNAADLRSLVLEAVVTELADHHGLSDDDLDELGWG
jgi:predicted Zn-dependent protease with MMP-like domain